MAFSIAPPDGSVRWAKWRSRFVRDAQGNLPQGSTAHISTLLEDPAVAARVQASFDSLYAMETDVRTILNAEGVSTIQYPFYFAFGRELWKLSNRINGASAALVAAILVAKWVARGLSPSVLEKVRYQAFSISAPVGP